MYEHITKEYIKTHKFVNDGLHFEKTKINADFRFAPGTVLPKNPAEKTIELRKKLVDIIVVRFDNNLQKVEADTGVNKSSIYKFFNGSRKQISRDTLAKICVGLKLQLEESQELFVLQGYALDPEHNLLDAIVVNCLECKEEISTFMDMCLENGLEIF